MSILRFAFLGVLSLGAGLGAGCGSSVTSGLTGGTTGSGGAGGTGTTAATTSSTTGGGGAGGVGTSAATTSTGSGVKDAGPDVDDGMPSDKYPAPFPTPPQVVDFGGPVLAKPRLVPVFFSNDDSTIVAQLTDFVSKVGGTKYWAAATTEYGVGPAVSTAAVMLTEAAPATIDDTAIQTWLQGKLNGNDAAWPAADANTVYVLHYPATTTVTSGGQSSCQAFGGYHSDTALDASHANLSVAYAVVPRCATFGALTGLDAVTGAESHELVESVTDPYPMTDPANAQVDNGHLYWERLLGGGEVGDLCAQFNGVFVKFPELAYTVQRTWSNAAAKAGSDPCVPELAGEVYFNTAPVQTDLIPATVMGQQVSVYGVKLAVGATRTIPLEFFSEGKTSGPWTVAVKDLASSFGNGMPLLELTLDHTTGVNGDKAQLTIKVLAAGKRGTETFVVTSKLGGDEHIWVGIVGP